MESFTIITIMITLMTIIIGILFLLYNDNQTIYPLDQTIASVISSILGIILTTICLIKYNNNQLTKGQLFSFIIISGVFVYITYLVTFHLYRILIKVEYPPIQTIINTVTLLWMVILIYNYTRWDGVMSTTDFVSNSLFILLCSYTLFNLADMNQIFPLTPLYEWIHERVLEIFYKPLMFIFIIGMLKFLNHDNKIINLGILLILYWIMFFHIISITADVVSIDN